MYSLTVNEHSDPSHVVLQILTDVREEVVVGVQMTNDLVAIVELVGAVVVNIVHWRLERGGEGSEGERERERDKCEVEGGGRERGGEKGRVKREKERRWMGICTKERR